MQTGFIQGRSCANNLWIIRWVSEHNIEFQVPLYCALVDYKGAFDALNRTTLGCVLKLFLTPNMMYRVMCLYFDAKALVSVAHNSILNIMWCKDAQPLPVSSQGPSFISWSFRLIFKGIRLMNLHLSLLEYADDQIVFTFTGWNSGRKKKSPEISQKNEGVFFVYVTPL